LDDGITARLKSALLESVGLFINTAMTSTVLPDIDGFDSSQLQQILNDLDSQTLKAGKAKLPPISFSSEDERLKLEQGLHKAKRALIDVKRLEATSHLVHGDFDAAAVEAGRALKLSLDVFGPGKIELVSCHLLLAEANLGLGRQKFTAEYLARANWCILKNPDCSNRLKSQLYRTFGKLYASQGKYDESLRQLANDIYFSSLQSGPEHVDTAGGYYYMATVFYLQSKIDSALGMCDKVVEIWMKEGRKSSPIALSESQVMEGIQVISKIVVLREEALGIDHVATGEACFVLGLLYSHAKEPGKARGLIGKASKIYQQELGPTHPTAIDCISRLQSLASNSGLAPSHSVAAVASTPDPQVESADALPDAAVRQTFQSPGIAADHGTSVADQSVGSSLALVPSSSDLDAVPDSEVVPENRQEILSAAISGQSPAPTVSDGVNLGDASGLVDDSATAVASVDAAVGSTEGVFPDNAGSSSDLLAAVVSVGDTVASTERESAESIGIQKLSEVALDADKDDAAAEEVASNLHSASEAVATELSSTIQGSDVAAASEELVVAQSDIHDATAALADSGIEASDP
jgi:tetratricopeptide (TPR) repeat protein